MLLIPFTPPTTAQENVDCGIVDKISFPVEGAVRASGDDFAQFRVRFGGLHTGVDIAFGRYGDPVRAIARGRVTYADPDGWDTEKGVVIVEHVFPDGEIYYSVYGHMEPLFDYFFPPVGACVTPESILGAVGNPSLSAQHLHLEIRTFGPDDGGPGYWDTNPQEAGWLHPLDFITLWQARLDNNGYVAHLTALNPPSVPPMITGDGGMVVANGALLEGIGPDRTLRWRLELSNTVAGFVGLPDGRILARTTDNTVLVMNAGRYEAIWTPDCRLNGSPMLLGNAVAFFSADNALVAYTPDGDFLWATPSLGDRLGDVKQTEDRIVVGTRPRSSDIQPAWRVVSSGGQMLYEVAPAEPPLAVFGPQEDYYLLSGATLYHINADFAPTPLVTLEETAGRNAALTADAAGNVYVFPGRRQDALYGYDSSGALLWESALPHTIAGYQPPLLAAGERCLVYALTPTGTLYAFRSDDGTLVGDASLYAAGGQPNARLLDVLPGGQVRFGAGFLTVLTLDGYALAGIDPEMCEPLAITTSE